VNHNGEVVGYSWLADGDQHAFLYTGGKMLDLNSLIPANPGWELLTAYSINDSGQITGEGLYNGQLGAFLLTDTSSIHSSRSNHTLNPEGEMRKNKFRRITGIFDHESNGKISPLRPLGLPRP
jgi:probable HAF family extracellular repeat protein